ncbi:MAG TPA: Uma2 family endonuclease [Verrucomicrobiae bacterium]|jgi:Uma2 family endonuclease
MSATVERAGKVWTEAELQALPNNGYNYEVVDGELIMSPKNKFNHGDLCSRLLAALVNFNQAHKLGAVLDSSTGFWMTNRNCRAPDISFVSKARLRSLGFTRTTQEFFPGGPDLAVEILASSNTRAEMDARLRDFFDSGTQLAWVIHPEDEFVEVCHSPTERQIIGAGAFLEGEHLLPGFQFPIAELFNAGDWD